MMRFFLVRTLAVLALVSVAGGLGACSQVKRLTGQKNDTVLQGEREPILPPAQTTGRSPDIQRRGQAGTANTIDSSTAQQQQPPANGQTDLEAPCDPEIDENCIPPSSEEPPVNPGGGVFSDG